MYFVYLLKDSQNKIYIGYTQNLKRRLEEHLRGNSKWIRLMDQPKLIYFEGYTSKVLALNREKSLKKRGSSYQGLLKRITVI